MNRISPKFSRLAAATALLATATLFSAPHAAAAAEALPELFVSFHNEPVAEIDNNGSTVGMYVYNYGEAPATAVTVTLDLSKVSDAVTASVPDYSDCKLADTTVTCNVGALNAGQVESVYPLTLTSRQGAAPGDAGSVTVTIDGAEDDMAPGNDTTSFPVTVLPSGPDLVAAAQDLNDKKTPVGPGDTVPLFAGVGNEGDTAAENFTVRVGVPTGATFAERYSDCTYTDYYPDDIGKPYVYGPSEVTCVVPTSLAPGDGLLFFDDETGKSLFNINFGRNLDGPSENYGSVDVALAGQERSAKGSTRAKGTGPSFAEAVRKLAAKGAKGDLARQRAAQGELDEYDNYAWFGFWSKPNTLDISVTAPAVKGAVGQTVNVAYEVVNNGPSDGGGPSVIITAPTGTVLLPSEWCWTDGTEHETLPESAKLRCNFESEFPATASGWGRIKSTVQVKIKSAPGTDGTIVARSVTAASESKPENNTAQIVITSGTAGGGDDEGGSGGGLPVTGAPAAMLAGGGAAVLVLGAALFVLFRRRRVVLQLPRD
ncbi:LPXTG cell wall anchor domain-containing protein [Micromonospora sp. NPDC005324]|uniref:LPXTG cell wall anchor domain-containing protein n=1 Tax=Micromonospora sp. NPDC005324 TaxID=3157033 RepID=UPI0033A4D7AC